MKTVYRRLINCLCFVLSTISCSELSVEIGEQGIKADINYQDIMDHVRQRDGQLTKTDIEKVSIEPLLNGADTTMYLVNYSDGWELLSANRYAPKVLMYSNSGNISVCQLLATQDKALYLDYLGGCLERLRVDSRLSNQDYDNSWLNVAPDTIRERDEIWYKLYSQGQNTTIEEQEHLLSTQWHQEEQWKTRAPYKDSTLTEHCPTGCGPVALAQILYYLHYKINKPVTMYGHSACSAYVPTPIGSYVVLNNQNIQFTGVTNTDYTWDYMPLNNYSAHSDTEYGCVSTLMVRLGMQLGTKYYRIKASTVLDTIQSVLSSKYSINSSVSSGFNESTIRTQVYINKLPVLAGIQKKVGNNVVLSHGVVIDGYKKVRTTIVTYYTNYDRTQTKVVYGPTYYTEYVGVNWGDKNEFQLENNSGSMTWYYFTDTLFQNNDGYNYCPQMIYGFN